MYFERKYSFFFISGCREGWHGVNCSQQCSGHCKDNTPCNHVTGQCERECAAGWTDLQCDKGITCNIR